MSEDQETSFSNELVAALDATGVPATIKGRVQRTILRFLAGGVGHEAWRAIRENLDTIEGRSRVNMMLAEHVGRQAIADPEIVERAKARFLGDIARKQDNIEAVARLASAATEAASDAEFEANANPEEPSQDWMNVFIREAENASSDDLRERLAGVLAGEARKPGTFSRTTVRFIAEVDKEILEAFQRALTCRFGNAIFKDNNWNQGEWFARGSILEDAGLVSGVTGTTHQTFTMPPDGRLFLIGRQLALVLEGQGGANVRMNCWLVTRLGMEVASLLPPADDIATFEHIAKLMPKGELTRIWIGVFARKQDGGFDGVQMTQVAWDKEAHEEKAE